LNLDFRKSDSYRFRLRRDGYRIRIRIYLIFHFTEDRNTLSRNDDTEFESDSGPNSKSEPTLLRDLKVSAQQQNSGQFREKNLNGKIKYFFTSTPIYQLKD
jgi:hypothetical protein